MSRREQLVTHLTNLLAVSQIGRLDEHRKTAEGLVADVLREHIVERARAQKSFFGDVSAQGNDGNWHGMSDWLMEDQK